MGQPNYSGNTFSIAASAKPFGVPQLRGALQSDASVEAVLQKAGACYNWALPAMSFQKCHLFQYVTSQLSSWRQGWHPWVKSLVNFNFAFSGELRQNLYMLQRLPQHATLEGGQWRWWGGKWKWDLGTHSLIRIPPNGKAAFEHHFGHHFCCARPETREDLNGTAPCSEMHYQFFWGPFSQPLYVMVPSKSLFRHQPNF